MRSSDQLGGGPVEQAMRLECCRNVEPSYLVGLIPVSVGLSLLLYAYVLAPRESP